MFQFLQKLFDTKGFLPLGQCFSWQKDVLITNVAGDAIISLIYFAVPFILYTLSRRRTFVIDKYIFAVFSLFIWVCALRHILNIITIWEPVYYLQGIFKLITSVLALITITVFYRSYPKAFGLDKAKGLAQTNDRLMEDIAERERAQVALRQANEALESRVQQRTSQLIKTNRELEKEIEQRKKTEQELLDKNKELTRINSELDNFVFHASHDLKDPIVKIEGLVSALKEEIPQATPSVNEIFQHLDGSLLKVDKTVLDLTEVGRIQKSDNSEKCEELQFETVLKEACSELDHQLTNAEAKIITNFQSPTIWLAHQKLKRIFVNLLSNALHYRQPDQPLEIDISTEPSAENVLLRVTDNGKGLDLTDAGNYQDPNYFPVNEKGEGLGLSYYIVKRIVANANGQIRIQSEPGHGSSFEIMLPVDVEHRQPSNG